MKKALFSILWLALALVATAQPSNCPKIKQLITEANNRKLQAEAKGEKFETSDEFDAWTAATQLDGATKCYVQDAHVSKMYIAEFGTSETGEGKADPKLSQKLDQIAASLKPCLQNGFVTRPAAISPNVYKGWQYEGTGENHNTRISLMLLYNPKEKKQLLFLSLINDPD